MIFCLFPFVGTRKKRLDMMARKGSVGAKYELGMLYFQGKGVKQDFNVAKDYFKQSCDAHVKEACQMYNETL